MIPMALFSHKLALFCSKNFVLVFSQKPTAIEDKDSVGRNITLGKSGLASRWKPDGVLQVDILFVQWISKVRLVTKSFICWFFIMEHWTCWLTKLEHFDSMLIAFLSNDSRFSTFSLTPQLMREPLF